MESSEKKDLSESFVPAQKQDVLRPTRAVIDLAALGANVAAIRKCIGPHRHLMAVVKGDGYGHGAVPVARVALEHGADWLGVALPEEGTQLRTAGIKVPILVFSSIQPEEARKVVASRLHQAVGSLDLVDALEEEASAHDLSVSVHLAIDTGMGRLGVRPERVVALARAILTCHHLRLVGVFSHFSTADSADKGFTREQIARFTASLDDLVSAGIDPGIRHIANSAAVLSHPEAYFDMVRPGIIIYGLYPSKEVSRNIRLRPAMRFATRISSLRRVPAGTPISYGETYVTTLERTLVATLPVGYADGYARPLSNNADVFIHGQRVPVIGAICMDMCMIDVSAVDSVRVGDEVLLFGDAPLEDTCSEIPPSADEIAACIGTINYEVICRVSKRVPRVYINDPSNASIQQTHTG